MTRPCVLVFAGADPSGGAGMQADIEAIGALGAHALGVITVLTVQDNDRVHAVHPVDAALVQAQAQAVLAKVEVAAVKIGIVGSRANAEAIAAMLQAMRRQRPQLPVVLDPVLASGQGDALSPADPVQALSLLLPQASIVTPNLPEAEKLGGGGSVEQQAAMLLRQCPNVLVKGGHGEGDAVVNRWFGRDASRSWHWPRLPGAFHGSGCTLASALAASLARGLPLPAALEAAQAYSHRALEASYAIAPGQRIPGRLTHPSTAMEEIA